MMTEKPTTLKEILGKFDDIILQIFYSKKKLQAKSKERAQTEENICSRNDKPTQK